MYSVLKLIDSYTTCLNESSLNTLCAELYNVASAYSNFYNNIKILTEKDDEKRNTYLTLSNMVFKALERGLYVLGIEVPEYM